VQHLGHVQEKADCVAGAFECVSFKSLLGEPLLEKPGAFFKAPDAFLQISDALAGRVVGGAGGVCFRVSLQGVRQGRPGASDCAR